MRIRYVVLRHQGVAEPHFDLMVDAGCGGKLLTWRLRRWPPDGTREAVRLTDHRREYLEYEGEVCGGRGWVQRVEAGECEVELSRDGSCSVRLFRGGGVEVLRLPGAASRQ